MWTTEVSSLIFILVCDTFMMVSLSLSLSTSTTTSSSMKRSSMQAMHPPPPLSKVAKSSTLQLSPQVKDVSVDHTIGFGDDLLTHILVEADAAADV